MSYEEDLSRMDTWMNDPSRAYEAQIREVYQLGRYLNRAKYRYIRMAYLCFIAGVLASTSLWAVLQVVSWLS